VSSLNLIRDVKKIPYYHCSLNLNFQGKTWNKIGLKINLKLSHYTPRRRLGEGRNSSYSFSTSALEAGEWSSSRPSRALAPGKVPPVLIVLEAGWAPEPVWTQRLEKKSFRHCWGSNLDHPVVQSAARHYTD
jgi:hypothetical protein